MKARTWIFIGIEAILYGCFLSIDLFGTGYSDLSIYLKFSGIVLCTAVNFYYVIRRQANQYWLSLAFLFLIISDYHLLITSSYESGVFTFLLVQLCFRFFLMRVDGRREFMRQFGYPAAGIGLVTGCISAVLWKTGVETDWTVILAALYFLWFVCNLVKTVRITRRDKTRQMRLFCIGLILYFLCDLNVGIFNLEGYIEVSAAWFEKLYEFAADAMWLFYLPGIVLITLSNDGALHEEKAS